MLTERIKNKIRNIPDFPKPGISFKDVMPVLTDPQLCRDIVDAFADYAREKKIDQICAIESRGFLFGTLLAQKLEVPFIPIRKEGKLPGDTLAYTYNLEYGSAVVEVQRGAIHEGANVLIHDDLLATGGTAVAAAELIRSHKAHVSAFTFLVILDFLHGREKLKHYSDAIFGLVHY